jgi:hypothetical protein
LVHPVEPARAIASAPVLDWRSTREPSVTTDQLPPDVVQPDELPSSKSSPNSVAAWAGTANTIAAPTRATAAAAAPATDHRLSLVGTVSVNMGSSFCR